MSEQCDRCRFFKSTYGQEGLCRRYPPRLVSGSEGESPGAFSWHTVTYWPDVSEDDWCGEFTFKVKP